MLFYIHFYAVILGDNLDFSGLVQGAGIDSRAFSRFILPTFFRGEIGVPKGVGSTLLRALVIDRAADIAFEEDAIFIALRLELNFTIGVGSGVLFPKGLVGNFQMLRQLLDFHVADEYISTATLAAQATGSTIKMESLLVPRFVGHEFLGVAFQ
jgi:hypothetical protein